MPVLDKPTHDRLICELNNRIHKLVGVFSCRPLKDNREGCKGRAHWIEPDTKTATIGESDEIRLAVDDFKAILSEIRKYK